MTEIEKLIRSNILNLEPYSSARDEFTGEALVFLDANENPYNQPYNRYPDPLQRKLKKLVAELKQVPGSQIFIGNGSDEPIDLLIRAFCEPEKDNLVTIDPSYGMYQVAANINNVKAIKVPLSDGFQVIPEEILAKTDGNTKLIFLCSPNNPSGNCLDREAMLAIASKFNGLVVIDEAYIDFAPEKSILPYMSRYDNLVVLQTFSKAWGMAGIRLGLAFAHEKIIAVLNKIKYPYNINILSQEKAIELLEKNKELKSNWIKTILKERAALENELGKLSSVSKIYPSDANFLLVKMKNARKVYEYLIEKGIVVRDRSKVTRCDECLRITVGTPHENEMLVLALKELK